MTAIRVQKKTDSASAMAVTLADIAEAVTAQHPLLRWILLVFYGRGRVDREYPDGRTYAEFEQLVSSGGGLSLTSSALREIGDATADTYDVLFVGTNDDRGAFGLELKERPDERFARLSAICRVVVECVDSGYWLLSDDDAQALDRVAKELQDAHGEQIAIARVSLLELKPV